jgi:c-di-GMP phosphodiesterase
VENFLLAKQSIFDANLKVVAYELLFRSQQQHEILNIENFDGDLATSHLINTFNKMGVDNVVGNHLAFINFTRNALLEAKYEGTLKDRVVIEVLEDVIIDTEIVNIIKEISLQGYKIALDDFVYRSEIEPLLQFVDIVKLDVLQLNRTQLLEQLSYLKSSYNFKLLAEKIESYEQFNMCMELNFDYFQGFFLSRPHLVRAEVTHPKPEVMLQLLAQLQNSQITEEQIMTIVTMEAAISYKLLRLINSSIFTELSKITALQDIFIQYDKGLIQSLLMLIALSNLENIPYELLVEAGTCAKICQLLAEQNNVKNPHDYFTAGLLVNLDALLDDNLPNLLAKSSFSNKIKNALLHYQGEIGQILRVVKDTLDSKWCPGQCHSIQVETIQQMFIFASDWAKCVVNEITT